MSKLPPFLLAIVVFVGRLFAPENARRTADAIEHFSAAWTGIPAPRVTVPASVVAATGGEVPTAPTTTKATDARDAGVPLQGV